MVLQQLQTESKLAMHLPSFWNAVAIELDILQCYSETPEHYRDEAKCFLCDSPCELLHI
jgi:hypothetical protein